ncbi:tripartite tricarboxylate transporter substrate binding protein [Roseomonas sp. 18066]|uniref:tripartite tricarboxylate transporter substrate binding protein n=1 Tax=Roseomonas sp. 18066 TaxID=2681412 RepID=UPI0013583211|nr:tripartite tricarboxylate transporter substrate binding protein [Roseomonas sp. 18066]
MTRSTRRALAPLAAGLLATPALVRADTYPSKPIRIVVPYAPGGTTDITARLLGEQLGKRLGQSVVIENKPGANSIIGAGSVASSPADGSSLVMVIGAHAANATLFAGRLPFDPVKDFAPVSHVVSAPLILAGSGKSPVTSVPELLEAAKKNPGGLNYGSSGVGAAAHLTMEDLQARTGTRMTHVPYRGTQPALQDLLAGNIAAMFDTYSTLKPQIDAGSIRALGISSRERAGFAPGIPTFAEAGIADFVSSTWCLLLAPAATPAAIVQRLSVESAAIVRDPGMAAKLQAMGFEVVGSDPEQAATFLNAEVERWGRVIRAANVVVE